MRLRSHAGAEAGPAEWQEGLVQDDDASEPAFSPPPSPLRSPSPAYVYTVEDEDVLLPLPVVPVAAVESAGGGVRTKQRLRRRSLAGSLRHECASFLFRSLLYSLIFIFVARLLKRPEPVRTRSTFDALDAGLRGNELHGGELRSDELESGPERNLDLDLDLDLDLGLDLDVDVDMDLDTDMEGGSNASEWLDAGFAAARQREVRASFEHAWAGYRRYAWGKDTLHPVSRRGSDDFLGMGISIIDSMDTALLMGLDAEFEEQYEWVVANLRFGEQEDINVFETTIRVLGGLLSAFDMSKRAPLLALAEDLATRMLIAFDTSTGIPYGTIGLKSGRKYNPSWVHKASSVAEAGTLALEFRYLSHATGNPVFREKVDKVLRFFEAAQLSRNGSVSLDGLFPMFVCPESGQVKGPATITFGARGDSLYEYFLKAWLQTKESEPWLFDLYDRAMNGMVAHLLKVTQGKRRLSFVAEMDLRTRKLSNKVDHLTCFLPGLLALGELGNGKPPHSGKPRPRSGTRRQGAGGKASSSDLRLRLARRLMRTCLEMYNTPTGLAPEIVRMGVGVNDAEMAPDPGAVHSLLRPETVESLFVLWRVTGDGAYRRSAWAIFVKIRQHGSILSGGFSGVKDVRKADADVQHDDKLDSFVLAETFKYLFLIFGDGDLVDLNKYVFNTEAHPLPKFDW